MRLDENRKIAELTRRDAMRRLALAPVGVATAGWLVGCGDATYDDAYESDLASQQISSTPRDSGVMSASDAEAAASGTEVPWATGGTKAMQGGYPDPFTSGSWGPACALYPAMTLGPCYARGPAAREDISDGMTGLPLRLSFLVVSGAACSPVPNAVVDIWHTGSNGVYSAFASGTCNPDRLPVANQRFCRGTQTTDANGRADFSTIFPGWYRGRSIHIHFTVRAGSRSFTSQLFFEDTLNDEIMATTEYRSRGPRPTNNRNDGILRRIDLPSVIMSSAKRSDGALHAWKVLSIRG